MKDILKQQIRRTLAEMAAADQAAGTRKWPEIPEIQIERPKNAEHGDFSTNIALMICKSLGCSPRQLAEAITAQLPRLAEVSAVSIAGPGFINFKLDEQAHTAIVPAIIQANERFGCSDVGHGRKIHIEFVSANPTGPLHVGHGRGAAYGAAVADLLATQGFVVHREYYVNDAGRQMNILATSVWLRLLAFAGELPASAVFPANGYRGEYVKVIAETLEAQHGDRLHRDTTPLLPHLVEIDAHLPNAERSEAIESQINALIELSQSLLGKTDYALVLQAAIDSILSDIREDLGEFGVLYQRWFSEKSMVESGAVEQGIQALKDRGHTYEQAGALWFRATDFGDEKDRVLVRENGQTTYFASDVAYHANKFERGFTDIIDIFGADHHGYVPRVKAICTALGYPAERLTVCLVQFATLYRGTERVQMSTRSGSFVTLRELREEVSDDAARFFYVSRKSEQHMDFDLELAKSQSNENPVYYIQYAHARICSVFRQLAQQSLTWDCEAGLSALTCLTQPQELALLKRLQRYEELLSHAALNYEPHTLAHYLRELANDFHTYYNAHAFLVDDAKLRNARLCLCVAVKQILSNGLQLLGVLAPETM